MATLTVNQGLQRTGKNVSQTTGHSSSTRFLQAMAFDDATGAFAAGNTSIGVATGFTQSVDKAFDSTPTLASQTVSHITTLATGEGNFTIRRLSLHDDTAANVTSASTTLFSGIDGQSFTKTTDITLAATINLLYSN